VKLVGSRTRSEVEDAVEVVDLVLEGAGGQSAADVFVLVPVLVEIAHADGDVAVDRAAQVRDRQTALADLHRLVVDGLDYTGAVPDRFREGREVIVTVRRHTGPGSATATRW
jgi:hypothetical protein